ncbi:MAG: hypothetical protein ACI91J_001532, partial [Yoonia sp.]
MPKKFFFPLNQSFGNRRQFLQAGGVSAAGLAIGCQS